MEMLCKNVEENESMERTKQDRLEMHDDKDCSKILVTVATQKGEMRAEVVLVVAVVRPGGDESRGSGGEWYEVVVTCPEDRWRQAWEKEVWE